METAQELLDWVTEGLKWIVGLGGSIAAIYGWVIRPVKKLQADQNAITTALSKEIKEVREAVGTMQEDVADILGDRLAQAHRHFTRQGWCSGAEKQYFVDMHKRYAAKGHNHLSAKYEEELLELPEHPPELMGEITHEW